MFILHVYNICVCHMYINIYICVCVCVIMHVKKHVDVIYIYIYVCVYVYIIELQQLCITPTNFTLRMDNHKNVSETAKKHFQYQDTSTNLSNQSLSLNVLY